MISRISILIPSKGVFKDKLMTTLGEFLGLVDVDGERLDAKDDGGDHDEDHIEKDVENYFNENSSSLFCAQLKRGL